MLKEGQPGDTVELKDKDAGFSDSETGFDISRSQQKQLGDRIGKKTQEAISSGGLLIIKGGKSTSEKNEGGSSDENPFAEDYPSRHILHGLGMNPEQVAALDHDGLVALNGIGEKTAVAILDYLKK